MTLARLAWALMSVALAYGLNEYTRPAVSRSQSAAERGVQSGQVTLHYAGKERVFPISDAHFVADDIRTLIHTLQVREFSLWGVQKGGQTAALQLFMRVEDPEELNLAQATPNMSLLRGHDMVVDMTDAEGLLRSTVDLSSEGAQDAVLGGSAMVTTAVPFEGGDGRQTWRIQGRLNLRVALEGGDEEQVRGEFSARAVWD